MLPAFVLNVYPMYTSVTNKLHTYIHTYSLLTHTTKVPTL